MLLMCGHSVIRLALTSYASYTHWDTSSLTPNSLHILVSPWVLSSIPSKHFNTLAIASFLILFNFEEGGVKMNSFLLMSHTFPLVFPSMTCLIHYHNTSGLPQQAEMTCFKVLLAGTRTKRLGLFKLEVENEVVSLVSGSSHGLTTS